MKKIHEDQSFTIGNTPLVKIKNISRGCKATVLGKIEARNPAFSVKCRIGANMVWEAEKSGALKPGCEIVEATSGNTGIALAYAGAARGYKVTLAMPESMSIERRKVMAALGAEFILTPAADGMPGAIRKAAEYVAENPEKRWLAKQFENPANPAIHFKTTGPEIWEDSDGTVDVLVAGVGTGGTISGAGEYLKKQKDVICVAVEPTSSPVITQKKSGEELVPGKHAIQGIGAGFIPENLNLDIVDRVEQVTDEEAMEVSRALASEEGILCGISCGAAMAAALKLAKQDEFAGKTIVVILPDLGERYLSTPLFAGIAEA